MGQDFLHRFLIRTLVSSDPIYALCVLNLGFGFGNVRLIDRCSVILTGSAKIGRTVMAAASENLTPVTLELGGKCPAVIDSLSRSLDRQVTEHFRKTIHVTAIDISSIHAITFTWPFLLNVDDNLLPGHLRMKQKEKRDQNRSELRTSCMSLYIAMFISF